VWVVGVVWEMDIDGMSAEELKAKVRELLKQKEEDDATIASLRAELGGGGEAAGAPVELASPGATPGKTEQEMAAEMEKQKQSMIEAMLADGTISQEEYEEMIERNRREKEEQQLKARRTTAWCVPLAPCCCALRDHVPAPPARPTHSTRSVERTVACLMGGCLARGE
jgi:hypothetical protein